MPKYNIVTFMISRDEANKIAYLARKALKEEATDDFRASCLDELIRTTEELIEYLKACKSIEQREEKGNHV